MVSSVLSQVLRQLPDSPAHKSITILTHACQLARALLVKFPSSQKNIQVPESDAIVDLFTALLKADSASANVIKSISALASSLAAAEQDSIELRTMGIPLPSSSSFVVHVVVNGKVFSLSAAAKQEQDSASALLTPADLSLLVAMQGKTVSNGDLTRLIDSLDFVAESKGEITAEQLTSSFYSDLYMRIALALAKRSLSLSALTQTVMSSLQDIPSISDAVLASLLRKARESVSYFSVPADADSPYSVVSFLDPISTVAQRIAPLLSCLHEGVGAGLTVFLNPQPDVTEFPIKRYYRAVLQPHIHFDANGRRKNTEYAATFTNLPTNHVYTMGVDVPEPWMYESVSAPQDVDNIRLSELSESDPTLATEYRLVHLLIAGQCFDLNTQQPTAGLQLIAGLTAAAPRVHDTLVMQNLGYFQMKAAPGVWRLKLAEGRHSKIYEFKSTAADPAVSDLPSSSAAVISPSENNTVLVPVTSFNDPWIRLWVAKRRGMERENLLDENGGQQQQQQEGGGLWNKVSSMFSDKKQQQNKTINVFSLASGHMYERLMKIMMLSVMNHTSPATPVRFYLIRQFFSPRFKQFLPKFAEKYGVEVHLVSYKWPAWLRRQTEKQRIIWGYKILFLDVLFPLDVDRIIYVDADQVVRADLMELVNLDLQGAPYGYTPFCDSNHDTEGYRFWKQGYWKDHLRGKPYHISALYVVDLARFRAMRAGDSLRSIYDSLSSDPNSLSNLDQDLPNYAQHMVPIYSLPQEWLWCETWCAMNTLSSAKSIDLCNNPHTKENKLAVARRLLPDWIEFEKQAGQLEQSYYASTVATPAPSSATPVPTSLQQEVKKQPEQQPQAVLDALKKMQNVARDL